VSYLLINMEICEQRRTTKDTSLVLSCGTNSGLIDQTGGQGQQTRRHDLLLSVARINQDRVEARELRCRAVRPDSPDVSALATT
jgi:hypothetical protein